MRANGPAEGRGDGWCGSSAGLSVRPALTSKPAVPRHLPFGAGTMRMGLSPIDDADWLELDESFAEQMAAKRALLATRRDAVLRFLPGTDEAASEALEAVCDNLLRHHGDIYAGHGGGLTNRHTGETVALASPGTHPLETAARLAPEDLCLLQPAADGYRLTAGCVCFPSNWSLAEKLGKPVRSIHDPVPGFAPALGAPVDRFFQRLAAGHVVARFNWLVHDTPELHQVHRKPDPRPIPPEEAGARLWLRVERQVLRRLPRSGAVLFSIRTHVHRLEDAIRTADDAAALAGALRAMAPELFAYRGLDRFGAALFQWLDAMTADGTSSASSA